MKTRRGQGPNEQNQLEIISSDYNEWVCIKLWANDLQFYKLYIQGTELKFEIYYCTSTIPDSLTSFKMHF